MARPLILLTAALPYECGPLVSMLGRAQAEGGKNGRQRWRARRDGVEIAIQETGMGLREAQESVDAALEEIRPKYVIATGLAGALSPSIRCGDAIVPDRVARENGPALEVDRALRVVASECLPEGRSRRGLIVSVDRVVRTRAQKAALLAASSADAVDMESAAVLESAHSRGISAIIVRATSDDAHQDLPDLSGLDLGRRRDRWRLAGRMLGSPSTLTDLLRLGRGSKRAMRTICEVLNQLLPRLKT